jgi:hypothetical protein
MLDALVRIAGATTIVNTAKGFSVNDVTQAPIQEQVALALKRMGCRRTAKINQRAINALHSAPLTVARIEAAARKTSGQNSRGPPRSFNLHIFQG